MDIIQLIKEIQKATGLKQKDFASLFNLKWNEIDKWKKSLAVPSNFQVLNILHFASLIGVDTTPFRWETYIEKVLQIIYQDEYRIGDGVDLERFRVHLFRSDGTDGYVEIENITNRKRDLFKRKDF